MFTVGDRVTDKDNGIEYLVAKVGKRIICEREIKGQVVRTALSPSTLRRG